MPEPLKDGEDSPGLPGLPTRPELQEPLDAALKLARKYTSVLGAVHAGHPGSAIHYKDGVTAEDLNDRGVTIGAEWIRFTPPPEEKPEGQWGSANRILTPTRLDVSRMGDDILLSCDVCTVAGRGDFALTTTHTHLFFVHPDGSFRKVTRESIREVGGAREELPESTFKLPVELPATPPEHAATGKIKLDDGVTAGDLAARKVVVTERSILLKGQISANFTPRTFDSIGLEVENLVAIHIGRSGDDLVISIAKHNRPGSMQYAKKRIEYFVHPDGTVTMETEMLED